MTKEASTAQLQRTLFTNNTLLRWISHSRLFSAYEFPWIPVKPNLKLGFAYKCFIWKAK